MTLTQPLLENSWCGMALTGVRGETVRPREVHGPTAWVAARPVLSLGRVGALPRRSRRVSAASRVPSGASPHESHKTLAEIETETPHPDPGVARALAPSARDSRWARMRWASRICPR